MKNRSAGLKHLEGTMEDALTPEELRQLFVITDKLPHTLETLVQND